MAEMMSKCMVMMTKVFKAVMTKVLIKMLRCIDFGLSKKLMLVDDVGLNDFDSKGAFAVNIVMTKTLSKSVMTKQ